MSSLQHPPPSNSLIEASDTDPHVNSTLKSKPQQAPLSHNPRVIPNKRKLNPQLQHLPPAKARSGARPLASVRSELLVAEDGAANAVNTNASSLPSSTASTSSLTDTSHSEEQQAPPAHSPRVPPHVAVSPFEHKSVDTFLDNVPYCPANWEERRSRSLLYTQMQEAGAFNQNGGSTRKISCTLRGSIPGFRCIASLVSKELNCIYRSNRSVLFGLLNFEVIDYVLSRNRELRDQFYTNCVLKEGKASAAYIDFGKGITASKYKLYSTQISQSVSVVGYQPTLITNKH